jgi:hypothetical protein
LLLCSLNRGTDTVGQTAAPVTKMGQVVVAHYHACGAAALTGELHCWGGNTWGQLTIPTDKYTSLGSYGKFKSLAMILSHQHC